MPDNKNRKRPIQVKFFVDEKELACYSARKSRSCHAGFHKCTYTCCACYSPFPMIASAIFQMEIGGNRRLACQKAKQTDGSQWRRSCSS